MALCPPDITGRARTATAEYLNYTQIKKGKVCRSPPGVGGVLISFSVAVEPIDCIHSRSGTWLQLKVEKQVPVQVESGLRSVLCLPAL